ncbi:MAG TPA: hypothetical protein VHW95_15145 [Steroidobacteraceae bacterium]|jgi:hypothetical protein|nr:hypothetical protein [Steroidobacteraceae bacterium]
MRKPPRKLSNRGIWTGTLLLALLLFRAYVPAGFMPANGVPFALELCPAAAMAGMAAHLHHHSGTHADFESCPFGSTPGAGPISHHIDFETAGPVPAARTPAFGTTRLTRRVQRTHQPRGPPSLA